MATTYDTWRLPYNKEQLQAAVENQVPKIDPTTKHWLGWNIETMQWEDTGIPADGKNPYIGSDNFWYVWDSEQNQYVKTDFSVALESVNSINGVTADEAGDVTLTVEDIKGQVPFSKVVKDEFLSDNTAQKIGIKRMIKDLEPGSIVKINEGGMLVEFRVLTHNYEPGLNGDGRTLVIRNDCYDRRVWDYGEVNYYPGSSIDTWLNDEYLGLFDEGFRELIGTTEFYCTPGNGDLEITTLTRGVFLLSAAECGKTTTTVGSTEGTHIPVLGTNEDLVAYKSGAAVAWWCRSIAVANSTNAYMINSSGGGTTLNVSDFRMSRPCFSLPETVVLMDDIILASTEINPNSALAATDQKMAFKANLEDGMVPLDELGARFFTGVAGTSYASGTIFILRSNLLVYFGQSSATGKIKLLSSKNEEIASISVGDLGPLLVGDVDTLIFQSYSGNKIHVIQYTETSLTLKSTLTLSGGGLKAAQSNGYQNSSHPIQPISGKFLCFAISNGGSANYGVAIYKYNKIDDAVTLVNQAVAVGTVANNLCYCWTGSRLFFHYRTGTSSSDYTYNLKAYSPRSNDLITVSVPSGCSITSAHVMAYSASADKICIGAVLSGQTTPCVLVYSGAGDLFASVQSTLTETSLTRIEIDYDENVYPYQMQPFNLKDPTNPIANVSSQVYLTHGYMSSTSPLGFYIGSNGTISIQGFKYTGGSWMRVPAIHPATVLTNVESSRGSHNMQFPSKALYVATRYVWK